LVVTFGTTPATNALVVAVNSSAINVVTPVGTGTVSVTVTNPDGQLATIFNGFTYSNPPPALASVTPSSGSSTGGTVITLAGSGFQNGMTVLVGSSAATNVVVANGNSALATTPPGLGSVSVTIKNPDGQSSTLASSYTYMQSPTITAISPNPVNSAGGTTVTITGSGFLAGASVMFGSITVPASSVQVLSSNAIQVVAPSAPVGTVAVTVTDPGGSIAAFPGFAFAKPDATHASISAQIQSCSVAGSVKQVVIPDTFKIVVYAFTNQYYIQPCTSQPLNPINSDGSWEPIPSHSGTIYVLLVSASYNPPAAALSLPSVDGVNVFAVSSSVGVLISCDVSMCPAQ
jgi:hypothetical protein